MRCAMLFGFRVLVVLAAAGSTFAPPRPFPTTSPLVTRVSAPALAGEIHRAQPAPQPLPPPLTPDTRRSPEYLATAA